MDSTSISTLALLITLLSIFISAAFNYFNLIKAKESKISEFRQNWIDSLREEISVYVESMVSLLQLIDSAIKKSRSEGSRPTVLIEHFVENKDEYSRLIKSFTKIKLRVHLRQNSNITEEDLIDKEFEEIIQQTYDHFHTLTADNFDTEVPRIASKIENIKEKANPLLKYHWERVKRGEKGFRFSVLTAKILLILLLVAIIFLGPYIFAKNSTDSKNMYSIYFDTNESTLPNSGLVEINEVAKESKKNTGVIFNIVSYADRQGDEKLNETLALQRAYSVEKALVNYGVSKNKIFIQSNGEKFPPVITADSISDPKNRRVDIFLK